MTGVNIGDFGKTTGESFVDLVKALDHVEGIERYMEKYHVSDIKELIGAVSE